MSRGIVAHLRLAGLMMSVALASGCAGGPPRHARGPVEGPVEGKVERPAARDFEEGIPVRVGLHWRREKYGIGSQAGMAVASSDGSIDLTAKSTARFTAFAEADAVVLEDRAGKRLARCAGSFRVEPTAGGFLIAGAAPVRGSLTISARAESLFVVNVLPLEDYLRGVVPREIGPRDASESAAVAAQAVAARTYAVERLGQYQSLPFDLFADVQDQVYGGAADENPVADEAIRMTKGLVLAEGNGLIEAYYSSTCGGVRSDIRAMWPHREAYDCLQGGPDGGKGNEWCRRSPHFVWEETWSGSRLSKLVRENVPGLLELPPGSVRGELVDLRIKGHLSSGRIASVEYVTTEGTWAVPGDRNRWVLRRDDGSILRSVLADLTVQRRGGRVAQVRAHGRGNGHGVGMCQSGAIERAKAGQDFREILGAYYPGARLRPIRGEELPVGRARAS